MSEPAQPSTLRTPRIPPKIDGLNTKATHLAVVINLKPAKNAFDVVLSDPGQGTVADWLYAQLSEKRERALRLGQPWHEFTVRDRDVDIGVDPKADYRLWMVSRELLAALEADLHAGLPLWSIEQLHKAVGVVVGYYEVVLLEGSHPDRPSNSLRDHFASAAEYLEAVADQVGSAGGSSPRVGRPTLVP